MSDLEQLLAEIAEHQAKLNELYAQRRQGEERQAKYWRDVAENLLESGSPK